jgi:hypothetical protein
MTMEPRAPDGRLADVTDARPHDVHEAHDALAIAALAAGDLSGTDAQRARSLVASCEACRTLRADLLALASTTRATPPAIPARPRDFRLSDEDAVRASSLRRRIVTWLAGPRGEATRPLAAALATVGVAAIVLSSYPLPYLASTGGPASSAAADRNRIERAVEPSPALSPAALAPEPNYGAAAEDATGSGQPSLGAQERLGAPPQLDETTDALAAEAPAAPAPGVIIGLVLLGSAIVLVSLRRIARRLD